jgi:hypothetical protein
MITLKYGAKIPLSFRLTFTRLIICNILDPYVINTGPETLYCEHWCADNLFCKILYVLSFVDNITDLAKCEN